MNILQKAGDAILKKMFPPRCLFCEELLPDDGVCGACEKMSEDLRLQNAEGSAAGMQDKTLTDLDGAVASFRYGEAVAEQIRRYKFCGEYSKAFPMAVYMAKDFKTVFPDVKVDVCVQVPSFRCTDRHSRKLARRMAFLLDCRYDDEILVKMAATRKQHELNAAERAENVKDVFGVANSKRIKGKTVLVCDDVCTSGHTLNECGKILKLLGAGAVYGAAFASTVKKLND